MRNKIQNTFFIFAVIFGAFQGRIPADVIEKNSPCTLLPARQGLGVVLQDEYGHLYYKDSESRNGTSSWLCKKRRKFKCGVSVKVHQNVIVWQRREHNHDVDQNIFWQKIPQ